MGEKERERERKALAPHSTVISGRFPNSPRGHFPSSPCMDAAASSSEPCAQLSRSQTGPALPGDLRAPEVAEEPVLRGQCLLRVPLCKASVGEDEDGSSGLPPSRGRTPRV